MTHNSLLVQIITPQLPREARQLGGFYIWYIYYTIMNVCSENISGSGEEIAHLIKPVLNLAQHLDGAVVSGAADRQLAPVFKVYHLPVTRNSGVYAILPRAVKVVHSALSETA